MNMYYCFYKGHREEGKYIQAFNAYNAKIHFYETTTDGEFDDIVVRCEF